MDKQSGGSWKFAGLLPTTSEGVFLNIQCDEAGAGLMTVRCDNAMALNPLLAVFKEFIIG